MSLKKDLENALKDAMRSGDDVRKRTIRMALAGIKLVEVEKGKSLDDDDVMAILHKEIKSRQETIADAQRGGREDLVQGNLDDIKELQSFLPQAYTPAELETLVRSVIAEVGAHSMTDMGKVMKELTPRLQGRATPGEASQLVRQLLQQS